MPVTAIRCWPVCPRAYPAHRARRRKRRNAEGSANDQFAGKLTAGVTLFKGERDLLAIKLMRTGAKKRPSYRVVVKEKQSKRDGAYLENLGTYNPTREPAEVNLKVDRVQYWIARGAQPTDTVAQLIKQATRAQATAEPAET